MTKTNQRPDPVPKAPRRKKPKTAAEIRAAAIEDLSADVDIAHYAQLNVERSVKAAREAGVTWTEIATHFGKGRQAIQRRFANVVS